MANEKRLIDANAFPKSWMLAQFTEVNGKMRLIRTKRLQDVPTVDAVEVVHGRCKYYHKQNKAVCTNCSFERDLDVNFGRAISCPNCGAKMDL